MLWFKIGNFGLERKIGRWLYHTFKRWVTFVPEAETINGFDASRLPIVGIVRYFDTDDEGDFYEWFVLQPEWWWRFYNDVVWPIKLQMRRLLVWLRILPPMKSEGGFLVPPDFVEDLRRGIPFKTTVTIDMSDIKLDGEIGNEPIG